MSKIQELIALVRELAAEIDSLEGGSPAADERNEYIDRLCSEVEKAQTAPSHGGEGIHPPH